MRHPLRETAIGEGAAAVEHDVLVEAETVDQLLWRAWPFRQSGEAFSKRRIVEEHQGESQSLNACAMLPTISGWLYGQSLALVF